MVTEELSTIGAPITAAVIGSISTRVVAIPPDRSSGVDPLARE
jgi:hypothetical protein